MHRTITFVLIVFLIYLVEGTSRNISPNDNTDDFSMSDDEYIRELKNEVLSRKYNAGKEHIFKRATKECDKSNKHGATPLRKNQLNDLPRQTSQFGVINLPGGKFTCECKWIPEESTPSIFNTEKPYQFNSSPYAPSRRTGYKPIRLQERSNKAKHLKYDDE